MLIDAIVLAGGRSSRLDGVPKSSLRFEGRTLLQRTIDAVSFARAIVMVGPGNGLPTGVLTAVEEPRFAGPAAGIAAGLGRLVDDQELPADYTFVLACDMPRAESAVAALHTALGQPCASDGLIASGRDDHLQPLAAVYETGALSAVVAEHRGDASLIGLSVFRLIAGLSLTPVIVPDGSTDDVDTWQDAEKFGITTPDR